MSDSGFGTKVSIFLMVIAAIMFFGEIALFAAGCYYAFFAAREYLRIGRQVHATRLPVREQFRASQRLYWGFLRDNLPFSEPRSETQQWLDQHSGQRFSLRASLRSGICKILFLLSALLIWPCAMLLHSLVLGIIACRES